jgi:hypothetical protein
MELRMTRLMISTFAAFLVIAAATTMLRSHAYTSGHPVASAGMMPLKDLHDVARVNKLPTQDFEDMSLVYPRP